MDIEHDVWECIHILKKQELFDLLLAYNSYVIEVVDRETSDIPVCLPDFYNNDYQTKEKQNV
jgi:hypothetical protein